MSATRRPIIAGNWKMYKTTGEAKAFVIALSKELADLPKDGQAQAVLCTPFTALQATGDAILAVKADITVAAQTMDSHENGAYTGEVSAPMLIDIGVKWVVLGHSERRQYFNETDKSVAEKMIAALKQGMTPIVCVGEDLKQREAGKTDAVIQSQMVPILEALKANDQRDIVIAYEPVWAIGTGKVCEAAEAARVCGLIRQTLVELNLADSTRILYGGSVKPDNVKSLMANADIDGALVGGASLEASSFAQLFRNTCLVSV
jgi:triosephosphate isomerase